MAQDRIGHGAVKGELRHRPVADIVERAQVEDHAVGQFEADHPVEVAVKRRTIDAVEESERRCDLILNCGKIGRILGKFGNRDGAKTTKRLKRSEATTSELQ